MKRYHLCRNGHRMLREDFNLHEAKNRLNRLKEVFLKNKAKIVEKKYSFTAAGVRYSIVKS